MYRRTAKSTYGIVSIIHVFVPSTVSRAYDTIVDDVTIAWNCSSIGWLYSRRFLRVPALLPTWTSSALRLAKPRKSAKNAVHRKNQGETRTSMAAAPAIARHT